MLKLSWELLAGWIISVNRISSMRVVKAARDGSYIFIYGVLWVISFYRVSVSGCLPAVDNDIVRASTVSHRQPVVGKCVGISYKIL